MPAAEPEPDVPDRLAGWRTAAWLAAGLAGALAIVWFIAFSPGEIGAKSEWFFGAVVFTVVMVSIWHTVSLQKQANRNAAEAIDRARKDLAAASERFAKELRLTRALHEAQMDAQQSLHRAEMAAAQELARVERFHLRRQLEKQATIEVSRAVVAHTHMLASLWNQGASIMRIEDRDEREQAMNPIFEQISQVVHDFSVELNNAHLLIEDDRLHEALNRVNEAALMAIRVAEDVHTAVVDGHDPQPNPIPGVQQLMHARAAEARRLAWDLLRTGLEESKPGHDEHPERVPNGDLSS
ncbi:hypothetical protein [Mycobacterium hubeiense]|uniref:hypothetical protein n=1 Tax=Mycobacterium hubeiense TaxID=1867256 RepID=UPI001E3389FC|nr:hypothetical protein [Mycobacterium sp. QGD 101]